MPDSYRVIPRAALAALSALTLSALTLGEAAVGQTIFLGPTPYLSEADSPFDFSGLGRTFFLEDFEDGELNTPGISQPAPVPPDLSGPIPVIPDLSSHVFQATPRGPSPVTNSVDGDDGVIDGTGTPGWSLAEDNAFHGGSFPPYINQSMTFLFDEDELGFLPKVVGFVWTGGAADALLRVEAFAEGQGEPLGGTAFLSLGEYDFTTPGNQGPDGSTDNDRFFGVVSDVGIARLEIFTAYRGEVHTLEIDHLQYGLAIPEPATLTIALIALIGGILAMRTPRW